jgi:hypothetical protein
MSNGEESSLPRLAAMVHELVLGSELTARLAAHAHFFPVVSKLLMCSQDAWPTIFDTALASIAKQPRIRECQHPDSQ